MTKFGERIKEFISLRNKIEHNKDGFCDETALVELAHVVSISLSEVSELVDELVTNHAIPHVAEPFQEIRDKFNRLTYRMTLDDGNDITVRFSNPIALGESCLFFGTITNPRPVDPLMLEAADVGDPLAPSPPLDLPESRITPLERKAPRAPRVESCHPVAQCARS